MQPSPHPAGNGAEHKRPFSNGIRLPFEPLPPGNNCSEPIVSPKVKKPKTVTSNSLSDASPATCNKGCPKVGWTIDQFCEVCHSAEGPGGPLGSAPSLGPSGAAGAVALDQSSSRFEGAPVHVNEGKVLGCVRGNGRCPREGWTIDSYCPLCHN